MLSRTHLSETVLHSPCDICFAELQQEALTDVASTASPSSAHAGEQQHTHREQDHRDYSQQQQQQAQQQQHEYPQQHEEMQRAPQKKLSLSAPQSPVGFRYDLRHRANAAAGGAGGQSDAAQGKGGLLLLSSRQAAVKALALARRAAALVQAAVTPAARKAAATVKRLPKVSVHQHMYIRGSFCRVACSSCDHGCTVKR